MGLSSERIHKGRPTPYPWERQALDLIYSQVSDTDPHQAWELHELHDPSTGRLYELDLVFLSRQGLFLVEIKSHPGALSGDIVDWTFVDTARRTSIECPYPSANSKARVLGDRLERVLGHERPWVHAAVFVPNATEVRLEGGRPSWLLTMQDVGARLVNGLDGYRARSVVNRPMMKQLLQAAHRIGLHASRASRCVGAYRLDTLVDDGEGYQEHLAQHGSVAQDRARVRSYVVPEATSTERRAQLQRAAQREAQTLAQIGQHPGILAYRAFVDDAPMGPAVVFEAFDEGLPLHVFLRQNPDLTFDQRIDLLQQVVEAVAHCHRANVLHRNLSPLSVLVRRTAEGKLQVRVHRFQTAAWIDHSSMGTRHLYDLAREVDRLYQAPEVLSDPAKATYESDVFSVGCLAWLLLTGQHPASSLAAREFRIAPQESDRGGLKPSLIRPDLAVLDDAVSNATQAIRDARPADVALWFDELLEHVTRPAARPEEEVDPRGAQKDDVLPGGLKVVKRLGKGGTAVVLHVRREGRDLALKVPHDQGCGERLQAEAAVLRDLRNEHIVALRDEVTIGGLPCLLLEFAGDRTLVDLLREEGTLSLELARRHGDDLLLAIRYLEESGVTHRDIKPGNIGFTSLAKKQQRLLLLDFSLSSAPREAVNAGTAEWRDPWLYLRGAWDAAADRFSTAAVLYYALTAARPTVAETGACAGEISVEAERLDAAVRDHLAAFFARAFARDPKARFASAEDMRQAWNQAFVSGEQGVHDAPTGIDLSQARLDSPVDVLPLSARARNALDRAGVPTVADLLQLPRNQLSVIRGVGSRVAREILALADQLRNLLQVEPGALFLASFNRPWLPLHDAELGLEPGLRDTLQAAGLTTTIDVAQAQESRVLHLLGAQAATALRGRLSELFAAEPAPGSLADWVRELIGRASASEANRRLRVLVGLDPLPDGRPDQGPAAARSVAEVAAAMELDPGQVHSSLQFLRVKRWQDSEVAATLTQTLAGLLSGSEPALRLNDLALLLANERAGGQASEADRTLAAALVRTALEFRPDPSAQWRRIAGAPWVARDAAMLEALAALGAAADDLAATEPLPAIDTVRAALAAAVEGTALADLAPDRRVALAARASANAAASARLELYPRGMEPSRALALSLAALGGSGLTPDEVRRRVQARYPEAAPLPERPALDALLAVHGLVFEPALGAGEYHRPGEHAQTSMTVAAPVRARTALPGQARMQSPDAQRAAAFQDQLDRGVASERFRVIQVRADLAASAADALAHSLGVRPVSLDQALSASVRAVADELGVQWDKVEQADREGARSPDWPRLVQLVRLAADRLVDRLLTDRTQPLLLLWPGALARYELAGALQRLVDAAEAGQGPAILLVVPSHADGLAPSINGHLPVPAPLPGQRLIVPEAWLANAHRAAEVL